MAMVVVDLGRAAGRTASEGMAATVNAKSGRPTVPAKVGAVSQHNKNMQAKRDGR